MSAEQQAFSDIKSWLQKSRWMQLILPLGLLVLIALLVLSILAYLLNRSSEEAFEQQAESQVLDMVNLFAEQLNQELLGIQSLGQLLADQASQQLARPPVADPQQLQVLNQRFRKSSEGVLYSVDRQAGAYYFSARQARSLEKDQQQLLRLMNLEPLFKTALSSYDLLVQVYINTQETELMLYPWFDVNAQFAPDLDVRDFPFYYLAAAKFNPAHQPVWVSTYTDPAGQGWTLTLSLPVLVQGEVVAVVGLDITLESLVRRLIDLPVPWNGYAQLMAEEGQLLAFPPAAETHWDVSRQRPLSSQDQKLNLLQRPELKDRLDALRQDSAGLLPLQLQKEDILLGWASLPINGWKLLLVAPKQEVYFTGQKLLKDYAFLLALGAGCFVLLTGLFVFLSRCRDARTLEQLQSAVSIAAPPVSQPQQQSEPKATPAFLHLESPLACCQFDAQDQVLAYNTAFAQLLGTDALHGQPLAPLLHLEQLPPGNWADEIKLPGNHQEPRTGWISLVRGEDRSGFLFLLDLARYSLTWQQLHSERERSRQAAKIKAEFALVVTREANRLLFELYQSAQQLSSLEKSGACQEKILAVQRLMDDLLDMSDEGAANSSLVDDQGLLPLRKWLDDALQGIASQLAQENRSLVVDWLPGVPDEAVGDRRRLSRLLRHFLRQALHLTQGQLSLQLEWLEAASSLRLELHETANQAATEKKAREKKARFVQASITPMESHYSPTEGGLGMGPLLTRQLAQELKGRFEVDTQKQGSLSMRLLLPLVPHKKSMPRTRILVVDDGPVTAMLATSVLEKMGYQVDVANSGRQALQLGERHTYNLVLMDVFMPGMDGLEAVRHWRELPGDKALIPIIAVTASTSINDRASYQAQGVDDCLDKPYRPADLRQRVQQWLSKNENIKNKNAKNEDVKNENKRRPGF